ncbi:uncharacterized protein LOC132750122 [Ruditapes philippinarum]|uniref:uncharacterized protein LOC132750122 n=1 Tax=Ruditapes philippinarum TaxID=129788 RepID=UPI00295BFEAE|nr:uncharacterized protein LOC132750122 [Ruditapes philippinarum]
MANVSTQKTYFAIGETVRTFWCDDGYFQSSDQGMTCRSDGSWSDIITCEKGKWYMISTKTGKRPGASTDANVYITLFGSKGRTRRIYFKGNFEPDDVDEIRTFARDVRPIQIVQIGHDGGGWHNILSAWDLEYVSIYVENMEEFYVFRNIKQQWVTEGNDLTLDREGNQSCINTFGEKYMWYPTWKKINSFFLGKRSGMSSRACKQACINWRKNVCSGVFRQTEFRSCHGFSETRDEYFTVKNEPWTGELFFRTCKKFT